MQRERTLADYQWKPIASIHEDYGPCVLVNLLEDPGYLEIGSSIDVGFDESRWTHFVPVPTLLTVDAERLIEEIGVPHVAR